MIDLKITEKIKFSYWTIPLLIMFYLGGFFQYVGLLSQTQTNILVIVLFSPIFLYKSYWFNINVEWYLLLLIFYTIILSFYLNSDILDLLTYIYYIFCTIFSAVLGRVICAQYIGKYGLSRLEEKFKLIVKVFFIIQLFCCFLQNIFTNFAISHAAIEIFPEDIVSGTLFLKSDASLAVIVQVLMMAFFLLKSSLREKFFISILAILIIYLGNSKANQLVVVLVFLLLWMRVFYNKVEMGKFGFSFIFYFICFFVVCFWIYFYSAPLVDGFVKTSIDYYNQRDSWITADRTAPIGQLFVENLKIIGDGPLTYYNPNTKEWLYNAGFSTFYSLYIDLGGIGVILYFLYYFSLFWKYKSSIYILFLYFIVFIFFTQFNLTLSDLSFVFVLNFVLTLTYCKSCLNLKEME